MKHYTVSEIEVAVRALEWMTKTGQVTDGDARVIAMEIVRVGLAEIVDEHRKANEQPAFIPAPLSEKGRRA